MSNNVLKLSDGAIAQVAKLLQVAILSGTDIVDNLRQLELTDNGDSTLVMTNDYVQSFEQNINKMMSEAREENVETN